MDFLFILIYVAIFAIGVYFDVRKKKAAKDSVEREIATHTQKKTASTPEQRRRNLSEEIAQKEKAKKELEKVVKQVNAAKYASEQLLKEKLKKRESSGFMGSSSLEGTGGLVDLRTMVAEPEEAMDLGFLSELDSPEELKKAFLYSEILNRRYN